MIEHDTLFVALTRPQMFAGVAYSFFVFNLVSAAEGFLVTRSVWVVAVAAIVHFVGVLLCLREPRFFDLWLSRIGNCPRVPNHSIWRCNTYRP